MECRTYSKYISTEGTQLDWSGLVPHLFPSFLKYKIPCFEATLITLLCSASAAEKLFTAFSYIGTARISSAASASSTEFVTAVASTCR